MKSDLKLNYVTDCDQQIQVEANIEGVELRIAELNESIEKKPQTFLMEDDINELIQMLYAAMEHRKKRKDS